MAFSKQSSQSQWQGTHQTFFLTRVCPSWICQQARCITKHHWNHRNIINIHQASAKIAGSANPKPHQTWWCCSWGFAELRWTGVSLTNMMRAHHGTSLGGLGFTRFHQISTDFTRFHQISTDFTRFHQIPRVPMFPLHFNDLQRPFHWNCSEPRQVLRLAADHLRGVFRGSKNGRSADPQCHIRHYKFHVIC